ncbi:MAG: methyltransferase domain-containing protein [Actinomycetota bacterium]
MSDGEIYRDSSYLEANPDWHEGDAEWKAEQVASFLERNGVSPSTIADVGCGTGGVLRALASSSVGTSWIGWDISPQAHEIAVANASDGVRFRLGDITESDETFDLVMALDVFEHVDDYLGFLRSLNGRGRHTVFHIPLDMTALSVMRGTPMLRNRERIGHIHYFSKGTALATLEDTGFRVIDTCYTGVGIDGADLSAKRRLLRLPRQAMFALDQDLAARVLGGWSLMVLATSDAG